MTGFGRTLKHCAWHPPPNDDPLPLTSLPFAVDDPYAASGFMGDTAGVTTTEPSLPSA